MKKSFSVILSIIVLACGALGTFFWTQAFYGSIKNFRSPLAGIKFDDSPLIVSKPTGVVVVVISGLSETTLEDNVLPSLTQISQTGASAIIQGEPPSNSLTSKMGVITGASAEINGAPPIDVPLPELSLVDSDSIFAAAHAAGLHTALAGPEDWRRLAPRNDLDETFFVEGAGPETDQLIFEDAQLLLQDNSLDLILINFTQLASAAQYQGGTAGPAYQQAAGQIDAYLGQLYQSIDLGRRVLVILGDHGFTAAGGHGGAEPEVLRRPLLMIGDAVVPGSFSDVSANDVAPTITTLLGAAPPSLAQGRILFEMLRLAEADHTLAQLALTRQRIELMQAYSVALTGQETTTPLPAELEQAQLAFAQKNASGAYQLARLAQQTADANIAAVRRQQLQAEQLPRLALAAVVLLVWAAVMWRRRGRYFGLILMATVLTVGLYHVLYQLQGFEYSLSTVTSFADWPFSIGRRITVSLLAGGGFILILLMLVNEPDWITLLGTGYGFGVLVTFIFALPLFWAYWQHGVAVTWALPHVDVAFWQINALFETMIAATLGLLLPWPIMLLISFVGLVRRSLDKSQTQPKSDALPGLRL